MYVACNVYNIFLIDVARWIFAVLIHEVQTTINTSNQKKIIEKLVKNNARLHEDLKVLRIIWLKKITKSEKIHSSLIVEIAIKAMMNQLMNMSMLNSYQECACKLFEKNCRITQCFRCHKFDHMIKFCRKNQRCKKCANKHHIKKCVMSSNRKRCVNCNEIMNSEDTSVSSDNSRWNKRSKFIETDCSDTLRRLNTIAHSSCCLWTL